jgi:predicted TIM-barrel enzyme
VRGGAIVVKARYGVNAFVFSGQACGSSVDQQVVYTAKRLRTEAQGCFNPGLPTKTINRKAVATMTFSVSIKNRDATALRLFLYSRLTQGLSNPGL